MYVACIYLLDFQIILKKNLIQNEAMKIEN